MNISRNQMAYELSDYIRSQENDAWAVNYECRICKQFKAIGKTWDVRIEIKMGAIGIKVNISINRSFPMRLKKQPKHKVGKNRLLERPWFALPQQSQKEIENKIEMYELFAKKMRSYGYEGVLNYRNRFSNSEPLAEPDLCMRKHIADIASLKKEYPFIVNLDLATLIS